MKKGLGKISYMIGFFGAIIFGMLVYFLPNLNTNYFNFTFIVSSILVASGIIIAIININEKEKVPMMLASLVIGLGSVGLNVLPIIGGLLESILGMLSLVFVPTGIVIALFVIMEKSK